MHEVAKSTHILYSSRSTHTVSLISFSSKTEKVQTLKSTQNIKVLVLVLGYFPPLEEKKKFLTSGCVNSGAWSFTSVMVMVAVAVPVRPTSLPAMSLATISNSYVVVGSVWKMNTQGGRVKR